MTRLRFAAAAAAIGILAMALPVCAMADGSKDARKSPGLEQSPPAAPEQPIAVARPQVLVRPTGSLFSQDSSSLVADLRARKVGDALTIIVQESASASSSATTKTSKDESTDFGGVTGALSGLFRPLGVKHNLLGPFSVSDKNSMNGTGQTNRSGSLVTKITVTVKEVLPNGNLKIEGVRMVGVNQEKQKVTISGVVRQEDINPDNTVSSIAVADMTVQLDGKGPVGAQQRPGLLTRIFHWLF